MLKQILAVGLVMFSGVAFAQKHVDCTKMSPAELRMVDDETTTCKKVVEKPQKRLSDTEQRARTSREARRVISNFFKDPSTVQFRNLATVVDGSIVCGELNAKNGYGAYSGFKRFYTLWEREFVFVEDSDGFNLNQFLEVCTFGKTFPLK